MQSAKEKISNIASAAKEHLTICQAKLEEKVEKSTAGTGEQKRIAMERRKAKEAHAKMELHEARAKHAAQKLGHHHHHHHMAPAGTQYGPTVGNSTIKNSATMAGTTVPSYPLGGYPLGTKHL